MSGLLQRSNTDHPQRQESLLHKQAKTQVKNFIARDNPVHTIETEQPVGPAQSPDQITDIFVRTTDGQKTAIEIQCSRQSVPAFVERTRTYTDHGIHVLWLIEKETYLPPKQSRDGYLTGTAFKDAVKWLQKQYHGRCYVFSRQSLESPTTPTIIPYRLESQQRERTSYNPATNIEYHYTQYYDTLATATTGSIDDYSLLTTTNNEFRIARFYDPVWWNGDSR